MSILSFNVLQLLEEKNSTGERFIYPDINSFQGMEDKFSILIDGTYYEVLIEKHNDHIWILCDFGKPNPRDDHLTNINTGAKRGNERDITETELTQQFFLLYHYENRFLYLSNMKKSGAVKYILKNQLNKNFELKPIHKSADDFLEVLKNINKIEFTNANELFNQDNKKRQALIDLTGTDSPNTFTISAEYSTHSISNFLRELIKEKNFNIIDGLMICGLDVNNFDVIFNGDTFTQKIDISPNKNNGGKYVHDDVRNLLLSVIRK